MNTFETINAELESLRTRLAEAQGELVGLRSAYDSACVRATDNDEAAAEALNLRQQIQIAEPKLRGLELLLAEAEANWRSAKATRDAQTEMETMAREKREKRALWESLVVQCREAKQELERLVREFRAQEHDVEVAVQQAQNAQAHLEVRLEQGLLGAEDYATDEERAAERKEISQLEAARDKACKASLEAKAPLWSMRLQYIQAQQQFENLQWQERNCRPSETRPGVRVTPPALQTVR